MRDTRVKVFRQTLEGLVDSLDATVRIGRWNGAEPAPQPLQESAAQLVNRLGTASRLVSSNFVGTGTDVALVSTMLGAMKRLDAAYVAYRGALDRTPKERDSVTTALDAEIDSIRSDSGWQS